MNDRVLDMSIATLYSLSAAVGREYNVTALFVRFQHKNYTLKMGSLDSSLRCLYGPKATAQDCPRNAQNRNYVSFFETVPLVLYFTSIK